MRKKTDFETRNGKLWKTRQDKKHYYPRQNLNKKNGKTGWETIRKNRKLQEIQKQDETRFRPDFGKC